MTNAFEVDFLLVGDKSCSGDAICIRYGSVNDGYSVHVVDGGYAVTGQEIIKHINSYYGSGKAVDHAVLTHADGDHSSGLITLLEEHKIGHLWMNRPWLYAGELLRHFHGNWTEDGLRQHLREAFPKLVALEELANENGISISAPLQGAQIGEFLVLAPSKERYLGIIPELDQSPTIYNKSAADWFSEAVRKVKSFIRETWTGETLSDTPPPTSASNESSVVQAARFDGKAIVLTGDVGPAGLAEAADYAEQFGIFSPALFQVPHHGSRRNVTPTMLNRWLGEPVSEGVERGVAYCSAAKDDEEHPRAKVINAFTRRGYPVHVTNGTVKGHRHNMPARYGWSSSIPLPFAHNVEE